MHPSGSTNRRYTQRSEELRREAARRVRPAHRRYAFMYQRHMTHRANKLRAGSLDRRSIAISTSGSKYAPVSDRGHASSDPGRGPDRGRTYRSIADRLVLLVENAALLGVLQQPRDRLRRVEVLADVLDVGNVVHEHREEVVELAVESVVKPAKNVRGKTCNMTLALIPVG